MRFQPSARRIPLAPAIVAGFGLLIAGCGSSSPPAPKASSPSSPSSPSSAPDSGSSSGMTPTEQTIKANWVKFFASSTPNSQRVALLENGSQFKKVIADQSTSSLASSAGATVTKVSNVTSSQATVLYSITVAGTPALPNQTGTAVYQGGTWKVGDKSFCALLVLELGKTGVPSACLTAG